MKENVAQWLTEWFADRGAVVPESMDEMLSQNYFEAGYVDSFGVIEMIADIEDKFDIRFTSEHFQERRFAIVSGLSEIISELSGKK